MLNHELVVTSTAFVHNSYVPIAPPSRRLKDLDKAVQHQISHEHGMDFFLQQ